MVTPCIDGGFPVKHSVRNAVGLGHTPMTRLVLIWIIVSQGRAPHFDTTVGTVADALGAQRNTVAKALRELEDDGLIVRNRLRSPEQGDYGVRLAAGEARSAA